MEADATPKTQPPHLGECPPGELNNNVPTGSAVRICLISDTHGALPHTWPEADILIHCGDLGCQYDREQQHELLRALAKAGDYRLRVLVPGNHDHEATPEKCPEGLKILIDQELSFEGLRIYGSPATFRRGSGAFERHPEQMRATWSKIPPQTDVLITHTPPRGLLDAWQRPNGINEHIGCPYLHIYLQHLNLSLMGCGHVHASRGVLRGLPKQPQTLLVNASLHGPGRREKLFYAPYVVTLRKTTSGWHAESAEEAC